MSLLNPDFYHRCNCLDPPLPCFWQAERLLAHPHPQGCSGEAPPCSKWGGSLPGCSCSSSPSLFPHSPSASKRGGKQQICLIGFSLLRERKASEVNWHSLTAPPNTNPNTHNSSSPSDLHARSQTPPGLQCWAEVAASCLLTTVALWGTPGLPVTATGELGPSSKTLFPLAASAGWSAWGRPQFPQEGGGNVTGCAC